MSKPDKKAANQKPGKIILLPVEQIEPSPFQARTAFDETEIAALAVSILQNGLLQPISVRKTGATTSTSLWQGSGGCGLPPGKAGTHPGHHSGL